MKPLQGFKAAFSPFSNPTSKPRVCPQFSNVHNSFLASNFVPCSVHAIYESMIYLTSTLSTFLHDLTSLERTIRFVEGCLSVAATQNVPSKVYSIRFLHVAAQLNLVRRFFRLVDWIDCAYVITGRKTGLDRRLRGFWHILDMLRWLALGTFFFLDMLVFPHALELYQYSSADDVQVYALHGWFQFIVISIVLSLRELLIGTDMDSKVGANGRPKNGTKLRSMKGSQSSIKDLAPGTKPRRLAIYEELLTSCFDLVIPAHFCGYYQTNMFVVSMGMVLSSLVTLMSRWNKAYNQSAA